MPTNDDERLVRAAKYGDFGIVEDMYRRYPTNHFSNPKRFKNSVTPLHAACLSGKSPMVVNFLLSKGADPNALDAWHCTPLHNAAAGSGRPDIVDSLLRYGAKPEITTAKGLDAIELARSMNKYETLRVMSNWKEPPALEEAKVAYQQGSRRPEKSQEPDEEENGERDLSPRSAERKNKKSDLMHQLRILEYEDKMTELKKMEAKQEKLRESISKEYNSEIVNLEERIQQLKKDLSKEMESIEYNFDVIHKRMRELSVSEEKLED